MLIQKRFSRIMFSVMRAPNLLLLTAIQLCSWIVAFEFQFVPSATKKMARRCDRPSSVAVLRMWTKTSSSTYSDSASTVEFRESRESSGRISTHSSSLRSCRLHRRR